MVYVGHYLGLSVKGIWFRGGKLSAMQGPAPCFAGKRWAGPIIPFIVGILGNMGFPARNSGLTHENVQLQDKMCPTLH